MSGPIRFVFAVIWFAIALNSAGLLVDATRVMMGMAAQAHLQGGISYGKWNRELVGGGHAGFVKN